MLLVGDITFPHWAPAQGRGTSPARASRTRVDPRQYAIGPRARWLHEPRRNLTHWLTNMAVSGKSNFDCPRREGPRSISNSLQPWFKNYAIEWYLGNRASAGLARFASRGGAAADPAGAPPAADTESSSAAGTTRRRPCPPPRRWTARAARSADWVGSLTTPKGSPRARAASLFWLWSLRRDGQPGRPRAASAPARGAETGSALSPGDAESARAAIFARNSGSNFASALGGGIHKTRPSRGS